MEFRRMTSAGHPDYAKAMALYRSSFPEHELREEASQEKIMGHPQYHFDGVYDGDCWAGLILYWETEKFLYVEHFCIFPELRGRKYGQRALEKLNEKGKTVILEIDPPVDEISIRRKGFYERCGFRANPYEHVHPAYHRACEGHRLVVMSCPGQLNREQYDAFAAYLGGVVMKDAFEA
ncbi:MAG: GNAT family N-acetyltransferase [Candidatus Limiplasma sp.]|nr:GNAT family N-acetyltransferase [Candidatus Limiplasma sp.]